MLSASNSSSLISEVFKSALNIAERNPVNLIFITNYSCKQAIEHLCGTGKGREAEPPGRGAIKRSAGWERSRNQFNSLFMGSVELKVSYTEDHHS